MDHSDAQVEQIVRGFRDVDDRYWEHDSGLKTVAHACVHLSLFLSRAHQDFAPKSDSGPMGQAFQWSEYRPITEALVGRIFEWTVRLGYEAHESENADATVQALSAWMDEEFPRLRLKIPLGGIQELILQEVFVARPKLIQLVHDSEHGSDISPEALRIALKEYLPHLVGIGVVATRFLATCEHRGANDINRDPEILSQLWRKSGMHRLEGLERTMRARH